MANNQILGRRDVARMLGVSESTIDRLRREGRIDPQRTSTGRCLFTNKEVKQLRKHVGRQKKNS